VQTVVVETATLADAVQKAARCAPTKGSTLDRSAGVLLELNLHEDARLVIKASDMVVTYRHALTPISVESWDPYSWRLPATLIAGWLKGLPLGAGSTVTIKDTGDGWVYFKCDAVKAKFRPIVIGGFPMIEYFDPLALDTVPGFGHRLNQVAWSTAKKGSDAKAGVHISGEHLIATDGYTLAMVPCPVPVNRPVTAPLSTLAALIKDHADVRLRAAETVLELMTDTDTQATSLLIDQPFSDRIPLLIERARGPHSLVVDRELFVQAIQRMLVLAPEDRSTPLTSFNINPGTVRISMDVPSVGMLTEELEIQGGSPFRFFATPQLMIHAFEASRRPSVRLIYGDDPRQAVLVEDDDEYISLVMPRATDSAAAAA
jgi:DNA polymerase III sliding clamp (beta) subunit (PCNA family)